VRNDIESDLAKGLFQPGAVYDAVVRFSNANPRARPDYLPDGRGMAVKLLPEGILPHDGNPTAVIKKWLGGHQGRDIDPAEINRAGLLDILAINFPVFFINSPPVYARVNQAFLNITNDEDAFLEHALSDFKTAFFSGFSAWERQLAAGGSVIHNPLYQRFYSMVPSRLGKKSDPGRTAVKYLWEPCTGGSYDEKIRTNNPPWTQFREYGNPLKILISRWRHPIPAEMKRNRNHLRSTIAKSLDSREFDRNPAMPPVCFELKVQTYIDEANTAIEDSTAIWLESEEQRTQWIRMNRIPAREKEAVKTRKIAPFRPVGTLIISPLPAAEIDEARSEDGSPQTRNHGYCEDLSFNPWNNVPEEHRPLGIVQRMKREVYAGSRETRFRENRVPSVF
jgi:hypothetical protein